MTNLVVMARGEMARGFALTGVDTIEVEDLANAEQAIREEMASGKHRVVVLDEVLMERLSEKTLIEVDESSDPLVIPVPLSLVEEREEDQAAYVQELVRRAIGFTVKVE